MTATSRKTVIAALLNASGKCLAEEARLDREIDKSLRHLIRLLIDRYLNWSGKHIPIGPECTNHQLSSDELRKLTHARAASRSEFCHRLFAAIVRDALRTAPEEATYAIFGLFKANDNHLAPKPAQRNSTPLIDLLQEMEK